MTAEQIHELIAADLRKVSTQEKWERFYLLPMPPLFLENEGEYFRIRKRLLAEGKHYRT